MSIDVEALAEYYANLLIIQYINKPKAWMDIYYDTKGLWIDDLFSQIRDAFDVETAIGDQLDIIAKYVGATRIIPGQVSEAETLTDAELRIFIKLKIIQNNSNNSNYAIDFLIYEFFGNDIKIIDGLNMKMTYIFPEAQAPLLNRLIAQNALPRPAGVALITVVIPDKVFGFAGYYEEAPTYVYGFDDYNLAPSGAVVLEYS